MTRRGKRMSVDERSRYQLHQRLREVLGSDEAGILMASLPPAGYTELATKTDLRRLKEELQLKMDADKQELRAEMQQMGRSLTLSLVTMMTILNGIVFTALTFVFR
jgi:hypothetical protein